MSSDTSDMVDKKIVFPNIVEYSLLGGFLIGLITFVSSLALGHQDVAWSAFHLNFVFWAGISHGGVIFACAMRITSSSWGRSLMRISESFGSFLPFVFIFLLILFLGREYTLPYTVLGYKEKWLNTPFVFFRSIIYIGVLHTLIYFYLYNSIKQDCVGTKRFTGFFSFLSSDSEKNVNYDSILYKLAIAIAFAYALSMSFLSFDFIMSLHPHFYSTLFGVYYFIASLLGALGLLIILSSIFTNYFKLDKIITEYQFYDAAKLMFGLSVFWLYTVYSQFLPIWYANMPEETGFIGARVFEQPWKSLSWVTVTAVFVIPFVSLIPRTTKIVKPVMATIAAVSFFGLFLEKIVLIYPSITHHHFHFGIESILISLGFLSLFLLCVVRFLGYFPIFGFKDKYLIKKISKGDKH